MDNRDDFSPANLRRMRNRAKTEVGFSTEMQVEVGAIVRTWTHDEFDRYCDTVPYCYVNIEGANEAEYYASLVAHYRNELAHYEALKAYVAETTQP